MGAIKNTYTPKKSNIDKMKAFKIKINKQKNGGKLKNK